MRCSFLAAFLLAAPLVAYGRTKPVTTVFTHARIIDGAGQPPLEDATITVTGKRIVSITHRPPPGPPPANVRGRVVDLTGKTIMPGIINAHGHLALVDGAANSASYYTEAHVMEELRQYERYGVTTMLSLGGNRDLLYGIRARQRAGELDGASVLTADRGMGVPGAAPGLPLADDQIDRPHTPEEARADVDAAAARGANFIKLWLDSLHGTEPKMDPAIIHAVIADAHSHHIPVAAHIYELADAKAVVRNGVDVLAHSVRDAPVDKQLIDAMKLRGTWYLPTFTVDESFFVYAGQPAWMNDAFFRDAANPATLAMLTSAQYRDKVQADPQTAQHRKDFDTAQANLKKLFKAGVNIGFGTDSGAMPSRIPGFDEHRELELMVRAGLTPLDAIHAATGSNARLLGIDKLTGTLAPGMQADFLVLDANPLDDIRNTRRIRSIWHAGRELQPAVTPAP